MKAYLIRLVVAVWFVGMVAFAVWGSPVRGEGNLQQYLPLMVRHVPLVTNPDWQHYLGLLTYGRGNAAEIYTVRADGTELTRLTTNDFYDTDAHLSPDNSMIAFLQGTHPYRLYVGGAPYVGMVMNRDGSNLRPLLPDDLGYTFALQWSPTRNDIAVITGANAETGPYYLRIVSPGVGTIREIDAPLTLGGYGWQAMEWSPDGQYLAYVKPTVDAGPQLWIHSVADNTNTAIANNIRSMQWTPTSDAILVASDDSTLGVITQLISPDAQQQRILFAAPFAFEAWVQHGTSLLVRDATTFDLYLQPTRGGGRVRFADEPVGFVSASPYDGTVLYSRYGTATLYVQKIGEATPRLIEGEGCRAQADQMSINAAAWAFDGASLVFTVADNSDRLTFFYTCYVDLTTPTLTRVDVVGVAPPTLSYLPYSSNRVIGEGGGGGYPPPQYLSPFIISTDPPPSGAKLFPDAYVISHEWRYLPEEE